MLPAIPAWIDLAIAGLAYAFAMSMGSAPERIVGGSCAGWLIYNNVVAPHHLGEMLPFHLAKDALELALITALAVRFDRWWLLVAGMSVVLWVATDAAGLILPVDGWALGTAMLIWSYIFIAALAAGTWTSWRRRAAAARPGAPPVALGQPHATRAHEPHLQDA